MAEGFAKQLLNMNEYDVYSAGTKKQSLNPCAVEVMKELNIDISHHYSKILEELPNIQFDFVITVCSSAQKECPVHFGKSILSKNFDDPPELAKDLVSKEDKLVIYRRVRDEIGQFISHFSKNFSVE
ncbi:MAG: arsenate reductase ArsC [Bdellovibrionales bacterium]|nr:arsenate reductase ArsC [Bdellovibrionales bacterium]